MNYGDYLDLDTVLNSQNTVTSDRNELMFIVAHQATELWFKVLIRELSIETNPDLKRIAKIFNHLNTLWDIIATLTPKDYERFIEAILLGIYRTKKKYKHIIEQNTSGSRDLPERDWEKIIEAKRKIDGEVREIIMEETQKVYEDITPKPSDMLWDKDKDEE